MSWEVTPCIIATCDKCNNVSIIAITDQQRHELAHSGKSIQTVLKDVPAEFREIMISGYCGICFDSLFKKDLGIRN